MIPLLLLAFGHWSSCAPVYIPKYGTHKYYEQPVCSYRWIDDAEPGKPDGVIAIGPHGTAMSPGETVYDPSRAVRRIPGWGVIEVPYVEPDLAQPTVSAELEALPIWTVEVNGQSLFAQEIGPPSNCYIPGEAHNELDVPCVRVDQ